MYLDKIVINGFKSFAQETEFVFDNPFVCIVGPNGSGKTNVADAMRWVMGEQSLKLMRMKKSTDAIFAGSQNRGRLGMAQVDLHINNHDGRMPIEYREVTISRRLTRNGETEYLINGNQVRLQDVLMLLAQANFGQKSYGVIGQGMITDILNANPQDRKEFFDEATGVKEFQMKRDQAINKLIRTEQNLLRVEDLLKEIKPRVQSLQRQVKKLEKRQELEQILEAAFIHYYGSIVVQLRNQLSDLQTRRLDLVNQQTLTQNTLSAVEHDIDTIGRGESRSTLYQTLQNEYNQIISQKNELLREQAVIKGRMEVEHERSGEIDLLWLKRRNDEIEQRIQEETATSKVLQDSIEHLETQRTKVETAQADLFKTIHQQEKELERAKNELIKLSESLSIPEVKERLSTLFGQQEQFLRSILNTSSLDQFKSVQTEAKKITESLAQLLDELHEQKDEDIAIKKQEITSLTERISKSLELKEKLVSDTTELRVTIQSKQENITILQQNIQRLSQELKNITKEIAEHTTTTPAEDNNKLQQAALALEQQLQTIDEQLSYKKLALDQFNQEEDAKKQRLVELQTEARKIQTELNHVTNQLQAIDIEIAKLQTKQEDTQQEISREVKSETEEAIKQYKEVRTDHDKTLIEIEKLKHQLELIGGIDPETVQEYEHTNERFTFLDTQSKDLRSTIDSLEDIIDELDNTIKRQFNKSFKTIAKNFEKYFTLLFEGGEAKLNMLTHEDIEEEAVPVSEAVETIENTENIYTSIGKKKKKQRVISGIEIIAQPPGKKLQTVNALSGGEKSMAAIALICSIIDANTPPFVVLDEVEAALDEANSEKFAAIIKQLSTKTQFILITHNRSTMRLADMLYGVTMAKDSTSHILSVKLGEAEEMLEEEPVVTTNVPA